MTVRKHHNYLLFVLMTALVVATYVYGREANQYQSLKNYNDSLSDYRSYAVLKKDAPAAAFISKKDLEAKKFSFDSDRLDAVGNHVIKMKKPFEAQTLRNIRAGQMIPASSLITNSQADKVDAVVICFSEEEIEKLTSIASTEAVTVSELTSKWIAGEIRKEEQRSR